MIEIESIEELNGYKFQSFQIIVLSDIVVLENSKDDIKVELKYKNTNKIKLLNKIFKLIGLKVILKRFEDRELLTYIQDEGFEKELWSPIGKAMFDYSMLENGDRIAVGISGGKDSLTVLNALIRIKKISNLDFDIIPIHIHPEEEGEDYKKIEEHCRKLGVELKVIKTSLGDDVLNNPELKNPCFLCARIRRGILYTEMKKNRINKLALGHHKDDIIETFLLNSLYQGNLGVMKPAYYSEEYGVKIIRPLAYVEEKNIIRYAKKINLPILHNSCPYETSDNSKRLKVKNMIKELAKDSPNIRSVLFNSIKPLF